MIGLQASLGLTRALYRADVEASRWRADVYFIQRVKGLETEVGSQGVMGEQGSVCKVGTQDPENLDVELKPLGIAW